MNRTFATYDLFETARAGGEWMGATAKAFWSNPVFGLSPSPVPATFAAWGQVTERAFARMIAKPDWGIESVVTAGREYVVRVEKVLERPFGDLIRFRVDRKTPPNRRVLLVAPMSGHYATLLRNTVRSLLPNCDVWITDWHNARDIPVSEGKFDIEDFTLYLVDFMKHLGRDTHVIAVCQPAPLALAATALLAEDAPEAQPLPDDDVLPMVLVEHFGPLEAMRWRWGAPGLARIDLLPQRDRLPLRLLRMAPGTRVAAHDHAGHERAVILAGGWRDFRGELRRGDFAVCGPEERGHTLEVDTDAPCIALVLNDAPIVAHARVHRWLAAWRGL